MAKPDNLKTVPDGLPDDAALHKKFFCQKIMLRAICCTMATLLRLLAGR